MTSPESNNYTRDEFLHEFFPDAQDKAAITAGMEQLRAEQPAYRLADMRRRLGITRADVAPRMGVTQGRVSAIEHAKPGATELRNPRRLRRSPRRAPGDCGRPGRNSAPASTPPR